MGNYRCLYLENYTSRSSKRSTCLRHFLLSSIPVWRHIRVPSRTRGRMAKNGAMLVCPSSAGKDCLLIALEFIIQQNRAYSALSVAITFHVRTGKTRVLLFGLETELLSELFAYLGAMSPLPYGPMVIPAATMELQAQRFNRTVQGCHDSIYNIEAATGMRQFNYSFEQRGSRQDWKSLDLISITRELSSFLSRFAFLKLQAETGVYLIQQMAQTTQSLIERLDHDATRSHRNDQHRIASKLGDMQSWYLGIAARCRYLHERTTAQTQTV